MPLSWISIVAVTDLSVRGGDTNDVSGEANSFSSPFA